MLLPSTDMSLPVITSLADCADFSKTIEPYLPQLYAFPNDFVAVIGDSASLKQLYTSTNPIISALAFSIATFPIFFIVSEVNKNYSQVDRVWSILPTLFNAHYAIWARLNGLPTQRVDNVLAFGVVWSLRLTYNYWRKGGYEIGSEDYRWALIKKYIGSVAFVALNIVFISTLQIVLLMAVTTPTYILLLVSRLQPTMDVYEHTFARALLALVVVEYFADGQQWDFHTAKHSYQKTAKVPSGWTRAQMDRGFLTSGLWKYSRHPNFAAEQTIWVLLYAWGCYASGTSYNWTCGGVIGYLLVFQGSTPITEWISKSKYPEYKLYQQRVGTFLPFGKGWNEAEMEKEAPKLLAEEKKRQQGTKKTG